ncbi:Threonine synthase, partial [human gut metagenome]
LKSNEFYAASDYIEDPHTAVASAIYQKYRTATGDETTTVIASTASPYKFPVVAVEAVMGQSCFSDFEALTKLHEISGVAVPSEIGRA